MRSSTLNINSQTHSFEVRDATLGSSVIDIQDLYAKSGCFTYDPGFKSTASCVSKITYIDGQKGVLLYRGYAVEDLCEHGTYLETCFLLIHGRLPNRTELNQFERKVFDLQKVFYPVIRTFEGLFPKDAHSMGILMSGMGLLSMHSPHLLLTTKQDRIETGYSLIALMPILVALAYRNCVGSRLVELDPEIDYVQQFLHLCFTETPNEHHVNSAFLQAMNKILVLHADHEQNASTSTVRLVGSSGANVYACLSSGLACLWGPYHGGANEAALTMLETMGTSANIATFIERAKDKSDPFKLMGFGHRVYKNYDPRAKVLQSTAKDLFGSNTFDNPIFEVAQQLEEIAAKDSYFLERKLYPNVDFYSGLILKAMGLPKSMFTAIFALSRVAGWFTHLNESLEDPEQKIGRPRQLYLGPIRQNYTRIDDRLSSS